MLTKTQVISNAIGLLGHAPILSLDNGDAMVVSAEQAYDFLLPAILAANNWRFATRLAELSLLNETPPAPYVSVYQLPSGWLKTIRVYPNTYNWDIFEGSKIYAQVQGGNWFMEYIFQPVTQNLPPHFVAYFIYEIACYLSLASAQKPEYFAALESKRQQQFGMCAAIESQNRPQFSQFSFPVLNQRYLGTIIGNSI